MEGVSFVVPVHNGAACVHEALASIVAQADGRPMEIIVVDDASSDQSSALLRKLAEDWPLRIVPGEGRGAAAAINVGVRAARYPIICQVDQDVVLRTGWMQHLVDKFDDPTVGAVQGYYVTDRESSLCARAMGFDLEQRYEAIAGSDTTHVCTGNSAYRAEAIRRVGLFDEAFGYGYDNDLSYRLRAAGYSLRLCHQAESVHRWREGLSGYLVQQYGFGYGRIDLVAKHPERFSGDSVSPASMMLHPLLMAVAVAGLGTALCATTLGRESSLMVLASLAIVGALALERAAAGLSAARRFNDPTPLVFPVLHLGRDLAWVAAMTVWSIRRLIGRPSSPAHSMRPRSTAANPGRPQEPEAQSLKPGALSVEP